MLLGSSQSTRVLETSTRAVYASGHLLFVRDGILFAQAFDDRTLQTSGEPIRLADGVGYLATAFAYTAVTTSSSGVLAHGPNVVLTTSLHWRDRAGAIVGPPTAPRAYSSPRLSPDQTSVMVSITDVVTAQPDLWLLALARGTLSRVTSDRSSDWFPAWSHDGSRVFFGSSRNGSTTIFQKAGVAPEELFVDNVLAGKCRGVPNRRVTGRTIPAVYAIHQSWLRSQCDSALRRSQPDIVSRGPVQRGARPLLAERPVGRLRL